MRDGHLATERHGRRTTVKQIEAFVGDEEPPTPELRLLRIAIWTRYHGAAQLAAMTPRVLTPLGGLSPAQLRRLKRRPRMAAPATPGASDGPDLTLGALLLRLASCIHGGHEFPDAWLTPRERCDRIEPRVLPVVARRFHALVADLRTEARRRRQVRRASAVGTNWPAWLALDADDRPRSVGPHGRYRAAHWRPTDRKLDGLEIRHTLRAATHAAFGHIPHHVELRAEDGSYALIPVRRPGADRAHDPDRGPRRPWLRCGPRPSRARRLTTRWTRPLRARKRAGGRRRG